MITTAHLVAGNLRPCRDPQTAAAVMEFYADLIGGEAVVRVDASAPPLAIEREERDR